MQLLDIKNPEFAVHGSRGHAAQGRGGAGLPDVDVGGRFANQFVARLGVRPQADLVGHRPGRDEEGGLGAQKGRDTVQWPGATCNRDFCTVTLDRAGRDWRLLIGRGRDPVPERALAAACDRVDMVISDRWLPESCRPAMLKADRHLLGRTGGLAIDLARRRVTTVAETQGEHGWWRGGARTFQGRAPRSPLPPVEGAGEGPVTQGTSGVIVGEGGRRGRP